MEKNGLEGPMVHLESEAGEGRGAPALEVKIPTCFYLLHFGRYQEVWPSENKHLLESNTCVISLCLHLVFPLAVLLLGTAASPMDLSLKGARREHWGVCLSPHQARVGKRAQRNPADTGSHSKA